MTDTQNVEKIYDKLKKLKALESSTSPHEAEAAAAAFYRVLVRHNLSMREWEMAVEQPDTGVQEKYLDLTNGATWRGSLLHVVARANQCRTLRVDSGREVVFGHQRSIDAALDMYKWLEGVIETVTATYPIPPNESVKAFRNAFRHGMVSGITRALREEQEELGNGDYRSLVLVMAKEVEDAMRAAYPETTKARPVRVSSGNGWMRGREQGSKIRRRREALPA